MLLFAGIFDSGWWLHWREKKRRGVDFLIGGQGWWWFGTWCWDWDVCAKDMEWRWNSRSVSIQVSKIKNVEVDC